MCVVESGRVAEGKDLKRGNEMKYEGESKLKKDVATAEFLKGVFFSQLAQILFLFLFLFLAHTRSHLAF